MGNKHSDLAYAQHDPRRYPASHIGLPRPAFPPPPLMRKPGPRSEIMAPAPRLRKIAPPDALVVPYGACVNGKTLKKMSKKEKKIFQAGAYAAPPIPRFAPPPPLNAAPGPFPIFRPLPPPMMAPRGFGPPGMLAIMPPPRQIPMQPPQMAAFYHPRPPVPLPQAQPLQIEYHKSSTTVNDNDAIVTVEADVARSIEDESEETKKMDLQPHDVEQKPPKLPQPNRVKENNNGNHSTTLRTSSTAKKPAKVAEDLTVLNRTPLLVVSPEAETIFKKNAELLAKAETMQNQQPISCIINDDLKIEENPEMRKHNETMQKQQIFEENDDHHHPVRRLEFDYLQDVDFAGKLRNVEEVIARKTILSKDQELKDLDDFDTVFAPKNQISNFGGTIEKNRSDFVEQFRKPILRGRELQRSSRVPIFDPISAWRQIDQSPQVWREKIASHATDDYPYDEYCRPVEEKIVVHLASKPPLKRLDSKKNAPSLDDLKNETVAQKFWESMGQNYSNGYGDVHFSEYYCNGLEENVDDRNNFETMVKNHFVKEEFGNGNADAGLNGDYFANGDKINGYTDETFDRCYSPPKKCRENDLSWISDLEARLFEKTESNSVTNGLKNFRAETLMRKSSHPNEQRPNFDTINRDKFSDKNPHRHPRIIHSLRKMDDTNLNPSAAIFDNFFRYQNGVEKSSSLSENGHFRQQNPKNYHDHQKDEEPIYIPRPDYDMDYSSYIYGHVIKPRIKSEDDISTIKPANGHVTGKGDYQQGARFQYVQNGEHYGKRNVQQKTLMRNSYDDVSARKIAMQNGAVDDTSRRNGIFNDDGRLNGTSDDFGRRNGIANDNGRRNGMYDDCGRQNEILDELGRRNGISNDNGRRNGMYDDCGRRNGISDGRGPAAVNGTFGDYYYQKDDIFDNGGTMTGICDDHSRRNGIRNGGFLDDRQNGDLHNMNNGDVW